MEHGLRIQSREIPFDPQRTFHRTDDGDLDSYGVALSELTADDRIDSKAKRLRCVASYPRLWRSRSQRTAEAIQWTVN